MACKINGCDSAGKITRGMCLMHYTRWRRHGDPMVAKDWPRRTIARQKSGESYVMIRVDNSYKAEHVLLAEKAIGRPLPPGAVVHHVDRDGTNNNTKSPWNLVVCPDQRYHMLIHSRSRALGYDPQRSCVKISAQQVSEIKASKEPRAVLARRYGVTIHAIKAVRAGKRDIGEFIGGDLI